MFSEVIIKPFASAILLVFGYFGGQYRERRLHRGKNLEEYEFYPFALDDKNILFFDLAKFRTGVRYFLGYRDSCAARQLILVGQQNDIENRLESDDKEQYRKLFHRYDGGRIHDENVQYLENYKRIVRLIGDSFPDAGIEILLHNLTNPAKALYHIKNNVTGRNIEAPATNLVLDLKMRRMQNQDKLNYELNIGARKFKCTTIPIYREDYGLVGAICINVDVNFLQDGVKNDEATLDAFISALCKTDMTLDENILSKDEYEKAMSGKRHFRDFVAAVE